MKKHILFALPLALILAACSNTLSSEDGKDLSNAKETTGTSKSTDDFEFSLQEGQKVEKIEESSTPPKPEYPQLVNLEDPELHVPAESEHDASNYYLWDEKDNFNNASITSFAKGSYPSVKEVGDLEKMGTNKYLEKWLEHFKTEFGSQESTGAMEHGFLNWDDGTRGAYVSYEFAAIPFEMPEDLEVPEGYESNVGSVVEHTPTFFTEFILIKDDKVVLGSATATQIGFPEYLQSLKF